MKINNSFSWVIECFFVLTDPACQIYNNFIEQPDLCSYLKIMIYIILDELFQIEIILYQIFISLQFT